MRPDRLPPGLAAAVLLALAGFASAADKPAPPPLVINADHSTAVSAPGSDHGQAVYEGHVVLTRGDAAMHGAKAVVYTRNGGLERAVVTGAPATFSWTPPGAHRVDGRADSVTYLASSNTVVLHGDVLVTRGAESFSAAEVRYDLDTGTLNAQSGGTDGGTRVHVVMPPAAATGHRP